MPLPRERNKKLLDPNLGQHHVLDGEVNPFAFSPGQLSKWFASKSLSAFSELGGLEGIVVGLRTSVSNGLSMDEATLDEYAHFRGQQDTTDLPSSFVSIKSIGHLRGAGQAPTQPALTDSYVDRKRVFGTSHLPDKTQKSLLQIMWMTFNDKVLIILTVMASISLALGLYQDFGQSHREDEPRIRWVEGAAIMVAVIIVVVVGSLNDYQKERQFIKLDQNKADRRVEAVRSGKLQRISVYDVVVGDVLRLQPGDLVPADGIFISGHNIGCDESSITGESIQKRKTAGDDLLSQLKTGIDSDQVDPFIISGSKVLVGTGTYLVTCVGVHSSYGKLIMATTDDGENSPTTLQKKLTVMAEQITKYGCAVAVLLFLVLFAKFLVQLKSNPDTSAQKAQDLLQIVIVAITIIVVAVPEGLPLAVTLALAFAMTRMVKDQNLVRVLSSCETMGNATTICSDKTGTLTTNRMTVMAGNLGTTCHFAGRRKTVIRDYLGAEPITDEEITVVSFRELTSSLSKEVKDLLLQSFAINSTAFQSDEGGRNMFVGSQTETALLSFSQMYLGMRPVSEERSNATVVQIFPFDSDRKAMATVVKLANGTFRVYIKGAPEILLDRCTQIVEDSMGSVTGIELNTQARASLSVLIDRYARKSLRTLGIAYRDFTNWPPQNSSVSYEHQFDTLFTNMVFIGIVGIRDPVRNGVRTAVRLCQGAGVTVRMVTGDNIGTAKAIAEECGIYTDGHILEGPEFRQLSSEDMIEVLPRLQVLARSSPEDKRILVKKLKEMGEVVAVTGDGTNDGPALRAADVGFSMGISGTEVAREASSIILMDDNFSSIVKALQWGRAVNDSVKKFLQFQLTVNITAVVITFVSAVSDPNENPILTPVQLLWINLIMDTFAALALATDPPSPSILERKPDAQSAPLITPTMWKMIIGQSIYQLLVILSLNFKGCEILGYGEEEGEKVIGTLIFNVFVWMLVFNMLNSRTLNNNPNILQNLANNPLFITIALLIISFQTLIISLGSSALSTIPLNYAQWGISLFLGFLTLPIGVLIRLVPDEWISRLFFRRGREGDDVAVKRDAQADESVRGWEQEQEQVKDDITDHGMTIIGRIRSLRLRSAITHGLTSALPSFVPRIVVWSPHTQPTMGIDERSRLLG